MSTMQRITLIGMLNYDSELFSNLELPQGYDRETFTDSLLLEHGEKCVMYTDPEFFKLAVGMWSRKWSLELSKIYEALTAEYNPIYNYDRFEEISDGETRRYSRHENGTRNATDKPDYNTTTNNTSNEHATNENVQSTDNERDRVTEHRLSADNSSEYSPEWKETTNDGKSKQSNNGETTNNRTDNGNVRVHGMTQNYSDTDTRSIGDNETRDNSHTAHIYGNVGVTTSTKMVNEIIEQRYSKNLYDVATRLFANELLLGMY